jgi:preprotein translocase subunit YajC
LIILYVVVFGSLYFFYIRPRSQKQKAARQETRKVELGERAQTIGGFVGTVVKMDDGLITLRGASGVELDFIPTAIARKYNPPSSVPETADDDHEEEGDQK